MDDFDALRQAFELAKSRGDHENAMRFAQALVSFQDEPVDATQGMSGGEKILAGIGKSFSDTGLAAKQIAANVGNSISDKLVSDDSVLRLRQEATDRKQRDAALMKTAGGMAGNLVGYLAQGMALPVGGLAAGLSRAGATGAGSALAASPAIEAGLYGLAQGALMPVGEGESRMQNTAMGGLLGAGTTGAFRLVGKGLRAPGKMVDDAMSGASTSEYQRAVGLLDDAGVPLSSGQRSGANWLKATENTLADVPWGGKPLQTLQEGQRRAYQRALLQRVGLDDGSDMITRETLEKAADNLSDQYAKALGGKRVSIADDAFISDLAELEAAHTSFVDTPMKGRIKSVVDQFIEKATKEPEVSGEWYQAQRSLFAKRSRGSGELAGLYGDLKTVLDDAFRRAAGDAKQGLDAQWAQLSQLKEILKANGGALSSEGFISPVQLARKAAQKPGGSEWKDLTRAAAAVLPDRMGNSGTAQRNMLLGLLGGGGIAMDPASLIYGPMMARTFSKAAASGQIPNVTSLVPRMNVNPVVANQLLAASRGAAVGGLLSHSP